MNGDMDRFRRELGAELKAVAYRQASPAASPSSRWRRVNPVLGLVAAGILVVVAVVGYSIARPAPAQADVFAISRIDGRFELEVVDIVTNSREVVAQLDAELGIQSEVVAVPVSDDLIGRLLAASTTGDVTPQIVRDVDGVITRIGLLEGFDGTLIITYGRRIEPGESYVMSLPNPACGELWGQTATESAARLVQIADDIRYETEDEHGISRTNVAFGDINPAYQLVDITNTDPHTIIVTYAANPALRPRHPNCQ